jgi:TolB protein
MTEQFYAINQTTNHSPLFFGRQTEIAWVTEQLVRGQQLLAILGSHRIGKTSLLGQLPSRLPDQYLAVYLDAGKADGWGSEPPLLQIASEVGRVASEQANVFVDPPDTIHFAEDALDAWETFLRSLDAKLTHQQIVLLIDNVAPSSWEWVRVLQQAGSRIILTTENQNRLSETLPGDLDAPPSITLGPLDNEPANALIKALVTHRSQIDPWAVRRIEEVTSNHPHYIHLLCQVLLECCAYRSLFMPTDVEEALKLVLDRPLAEFIVLWESSLAREQVLLSVFAALRGHGGIATQYDIQQSCARYGPPPSLKDIVVTLESLVQRGLLEKLGASSYRFELELFRIWIRHHYPPGPLLRRELWRFGRPVIAVPFVALRRAFVRKRALWISLSIIILVVLIVALQPSFQRQSSHPISSSTPFTVVSIGTLSATQVTAVLPRVTHTPVPTGVLPGYDLVLMSRKNQDAPWQIYAINSRTGKHLRLTETESNERTPKWSPDGSRIVFASDREGNREIYIMDDLDDWNDDRLINLTQHKAPDWQPAWSPDGERVAFSSHRDENWEVYLINADGSGLERVTEHPASDFSPCWAPDSTKLVFVSRRHGDADLFVIDIDTGELAQLTESERDEYDPAWSPNGEWIAYVTQVEDQSDVFVMRADGTDQTNLTNSPYANDFQPIWTADSEQIIYVSYTTADGDHEIYRMGRDKSQVTKLTDDNEDNLSPSLRYAYSGIK